MNYCQFRNETIKRMANAGGGGLLPAKYQQVEYLESSGTQYINTQYAPTVNNLRIVTRLNVLQKVSDNDRFCGSQNGSNCSIVPWYNKVAAYGTPPLAVVGVGSSYHIGQVNTSYNTIYDIDLTADNGNVSGNYCGYSINTTYSGTVGNNLSIYIFGSNVSNHQAGRDRCAARFYMFDIYSGGELKFSAVPCYRKSDNKPGMYDILTSTFLTNAGSGEFSVGQDV